MPRNPAARKTSTPPASANMATKVVRPGQADSKRQARGHAAKAQANADAVAKLNANRSAKPAPQRDGVWTGSKAALPGTWVADPIKGRPANGAGEYRQVAANEMHGSMRMVRFTDGTGRSMGAATKVFVAPDTAPVATPEPEPTQPEPTTCTVAPTGRPASDGRLATTCGTVANPAGYCCECGTQVAEPGGTEPLAVADNPVVRYTLAKAEHALLQQWIKDGSRPPKPATPNLDVVEAEHAAAGGKPKGKAQRTAGAPRAAANRDATYAQALEAKRAGADKRGKGTKVTDAELAEVIAKAKADRPANTASQELEVAYWLGGLAVSRGRWMAAWGAAAPSQQAVA